jgi:hypothetical protein
MAKPDDLEAVRTIAAALSGFSPEEQERILRWVREKVGLAPAARTLPETRTPQPPLPVALARPHQLSDSQQAPASGKDLKTFVAGKNPRSDAQFTATVAYFYRFEAPPEQRKNEIDAATLQDACRLAGRARLPHPSMTLTNAKNQGLIDKGSDAGKYIINTVGENLVAMTLPGQSDASAKGKKPKKPKKSKKPAKKTIRKNK